MELILLAALALAVIGWAKALRYRRAVIEWQKVAVEAINLNSQAIATAEALLAERNRPDTTYQAPDGVGSTPSTLLH